MAGPLQHLRTFLKGHGLLAVVLAFTLLFSLYKLTEAPPTWYDEGMIVQLSMNMVLHGTLATQVAPGDFASAAYTSTGFPVTVPIAVSFALFGISLASARAVMVVYIVLLLCASYYFLERLAGKRIALFSAALLATFAPLYGNGKNVLGEVPGLFFFILSLTFAYKMFEEGKWTKKNALLAGIFFGLCVATKPTFLVLGPAALIALGYVWFYERRRIPLAMLVWSGAAALLPVGAWVLTQFNIHDPVSRILQFYANPYQLTDLPALALQNVVRFFRESTPLYLLGMLAPWGLALFARVKSRAHITFAEIVAFLVTLFVLAAYVRTPGWYRYLFPAQILAILFFPVAVDYFVRRFSPTRAGDVVRRAGTVLLCGALLLQVYVLFFGSWVQAYWASARTSTLQAYFGQLDPRTTFFVYDVPQIPIFLPQGAPYYQYISVNGEGYWALGDEERSVIGAQIPDIIVASNGLEASSTQLFPGYRKRSDVANVIVLERDPGVPVAH